MYSLKSNGQEGIPEEKNMQWQNIAKGTTGPEADMEFVKKITPPDFQAKKFYTVNFTLFQRF